jgi:hypothetical protein
VGTLVEAGRTIHTFESPAVSVRALGHIGEWCTCPHAGTRVRAETDPVPPHERSAPPAAESALVASLELHEASVWSRCFAAAASLPGDPLGQSGLQLVGDGRLISTGALLVDGPLGRVGCAATHPRHRGKSLREEINRVRPAEARRLGARMVHVEIDARYSNSAKLPFARLYDRRFYTSVTADESDST